MQRIMKGYVFRLYPTTEQIQLIEKSFGCSRYIYNYYLSKNKKIIEKYEKKLKGLNKWLARAKVGSKNRYKIIRKIQTIYKKLKNARKFNLHSISNKITNENDIIVTEKLQINKMVQNKTLSKKIYDVSWYELIRQLEYKSK